MKEIVIISGKGGTGKTSITASFCSIANKKGKKIIIGDCDVDAANMYILLKSKIEKQEDFYGSKFAMIDKSLCTKCGKCLEVCKFDAIKDDFIVDKISCEGCKFCYRVCPKNAISMVDRFSGKLFISNSKYGKFIHARLEPGEENSGRLVTKIKKKIRELSDNSTELIILDGPPGIGCPVIATLSASDIAIIVTEPTISAISDMQRIYDLTLNFKIKTLLIINKWDINKEKSETIEGYCNDKNIKIIGKIPFDDMVEKAIEKEIPFVEQKDSIAALSIIDIWEKLYGEL